MANSSIEYQGLRLLLIGSGSGFLVQTFDLVGGAGVADSSIEIQGYRVLAHDNGDEETFSPVTTTSTGANDVSVDWQGLRIKLHPTGIDVVIGGVAVPTYAVVVSPL